MLSRGLVLLATSVKIPPSPDWRSLVRSGDRLFIGSGSAVPNGLIEDLIKQKNYFHDLQLVHGFTVGPHRWVEREFDALFTTNTFYIGDEKVRKAVAEGRVDYTPCKQSEISSLLASDTLPLDVALIMVSPPDEYGYCSLGTNVDINLTAARQAKKVVAQVNSLMPRTQGYSHVHINEFDACIELDQALPCSTESDTDQVSERIGQYLSRLVDDGATLQIGRGRAPQAVLDYLSHHRDLGIHTAELPEKIIPLFKSGAINNRLKTFHPGKIVASSCYGSQKLYDFIDRNSHVEFYPSGYLETPRNIARNDHMISINTALEVDLAGQVVADSVGYRFYSGIGSQVDFINGAAMSRGGKPIVALKSTAKDETFSRIVPHISEGAGVITTRGNAHFVVTEFGIASLKGKSIRERALELIRIAHPKFRPSLLKEVRKNFWVPDYQRTVPMEIPELEQQVKPLKIGQSAFKLRPLNPADERHLQAFFYSHTKDTLRLRYAQIPSQMSREKSCNLVSVDQSKDLALCIVSQERSKVRIEAVGRFYLIPHDNSCEVAFVTRENHQGKGMAKHLLQEMTAVAKKRGLKAMKAFVLAENKPMIRVFERHGFRRSKDSDLHELILELPLESTK